MDNSNIQFILASASPRRSELLHGVGARFEICVSEVDEDAVAAAYSEPSDIVAALACAKCSAVAQRFAHIPVVAADTIVCVDDVVLGKPRDTADAVRMLTMLSGRRHTVYTGVAVSMGGEVKSTVCSSDVFFRELDEGEIERYAASGEPLDKAGAYGIQELGALLVERVDGDYFNVVGLPLVTTARLLLDFGVRLL